jgi:hypothetical protein
MPDTPVREAEPTSIQLTRIEGIINLIKYQGEVNSKDMSHVKVDIEKLKTDVHTLQLEAVARDKLAVTVATTLKDSDAALIVKNEQKWTPLTRIYIIGGTISYAMTIWLTYHK